MIIRRAGDEVRGVGDDPNSPGHSLHETSACRFGNDPKTSVTNGFSQRRVAPNLYACDASVFPFATDKTTTISIMAFTLRACEYIVESLKRGAHT